MKKLACFLILTGCVAWCARTAEPEKMDLFLLIGQSNMAGRGGIGEKDRQTHPRIFMLDRAGAWVPARDPVHFDKPRAAGVGLCSEFARQYAAQHPDSRVGLIPCAMGGSSLGEWEPEHPLYSNAVARARTAMKNGRLSGILWHQGEADTTGERRATYAPRFRRMIARLRTDLDAQDVPLVVGELGSFFKSAPAFNSMLRLAVNEISLCAMVSAEGLGDRGDHLHFSTEALYTLGQRYYEAFLPLSRQKVLVNGGLERMKGRRCTAWRPYASGFTVDTVSRRSGKQSVRCEVTDPLHGGGIVQELVYPNPTKTPVVFGGWSRSERVKAQDYSVYLDIWYEGGGNDWAVRAEWENGTHDWLPAQKVFYPKKPIAKIQMFVFLRNGTGKAWFDDLFLERRQPSLEIISKIRKTDRPFSEGDRVILKFTKPAKWSLQQGTIHGFVSGKGEKVFFRADEKSSTFPIAFDVNGEKDVATVTLPVLTLRKNPLPSGASEVWIADAMRKITPLTYPEANDLSPQKKISLELARCERESAQIQVTTAMDAEWKNGSLTLPSLRTAGGRPFRGSVIWERIGYLAREPGYFVHPFAPPEEESWLPDPLLPAGPFRVRKGATQGLWLTVHAARDAAPGVYEGDILVTEQGNERAKIHLSVEVLDFSLPKTFGMPTAFSVMDGFTRARYPHRFAAMKRRSHEIMLDHRLNPDDISRTEPPAIEDLLWARERGMNRFNILNMVPKPKDPNTLWVCYADPQQVFTPEFYESFKARLLPYVAELRKHGLDKLGYIYGFDEREHEYYRGIDDLWKKLQRDVPGIPLMTTAMMYHDMVNGRTNFPCLMTSDWFCPITSSFRLEMTRKMHEAGKQVWWYTCCGPTYPYANMSSLEYPPIEGRLLGWMTHLYRSDGLLFWHVNLWNGNPILDDRDTFFPAWHTASSLHMPGDGIFLYPGEHDIFPSIRLAQIRDGVEDYEWLQLAAAGQGAEAADACSRELIQDMTHFHRDPANLRRVRRKLADLIRRKTE